MSPRKGSRGSASGPEAPASSVDRGDLDRPLAEVLGASSAKTFEKHLGLVTIGQLLDEPPERVLRRLFADDGAAARA